MVRWPDEAAHHLRVHELKFARYDVFDPDYFELTFCLPWLGAWMTVPDDETFLSKQVRAKVRNVWQHRFVVSNVLASHLVGALVIVGGMQAIEFVLTHGKPFRVFETLPIEFQINWLFNASDIGVIVVFLFRGVVAMWKAEGAR